LKRFSLNRNWKNETNKWVNSNHQYKKQYR
jgi:hypothetical protein